MATKIDNYLLSLRKTKKVLSEKTIEGYLVKLQSESFFKNKNIKSLILKGVRIGIRHGKEEKNTEYSQEVLRTYIIIPTKLENPYMWNEGNPEESNKITHHSLVNVHFTEEGQDEPKYNFESSDNLFPLLNNAFHYIKRERDSIKQMIIKEEVRADVETLYDISNGYMKIKAFNLSNISGSKLLQRRAEFIAYHWAHDWTGFRIKPKYFKINI